MTGGIPYGRAANVTDEVCIANPSDVRRMLCGRWRDFVPAPSSPGRVHEVCARLWVLTPNVAGPDATGCCPECGGDVPLVDGRVAAHGKWVVDRAGMRTSGESCPGEGLPPEEQP